MEQAEKNIQKFWNIFFAGVFLTKIFDPMRYNRRIKFSVHLCQLYSKL